MSLGEFQERVEGSQLIETSAATQAAQPDPTISDPQISLTNRENRGANSKEQTQEEQESSEPLADDLQPGQSHLDQTDKNDTTTTPCTKAANNLILQNAPTSEKHKSEAPKSALNIFVQNNEDVESTYHLKWINWNTGKVPIVMQSINGPCPLIAIMNVSLLREKIKLPDMLEQITANQLLTYLGECLMDSIPTDIQNDEGALLNLEQNIHDAIEVLPRLETGLDVNIRFTGITDFEYTQEYVIFDLLRIPLYHGWLSDPSLEELQNAIGRRSYNQLVDSIITGKNSIDPVTSARVLMAEEFLERTASQLTQYGLNELRGKIKDNEIGVLFRNNHFLTLLKRDGEIYTLVTDHGYLTEERVIWESLDSIEGAGRFFNSNFEPSDTVQMPSNTNQQKLGEYLQDQHGEASEDEVLARLGAAEMSQEDHKLAKRLQAEEEERYHKMLSERYGDGDYQMDNSPIGHFNPNEHALVETTELNSDQPPLDKIHWPSLKAAHSSQSEQSNCLDQQVTSAGRAIRQADHQASLGEQKQEFSTSRGRKVVGPASTGQLAEMTAESGRLATTTTVVAHEQQHQQLMNSQSENRHQIPASSNRRSRSEKSTKESNCLIS